MPLAKVVDVASDFSGKVIQGADAFISKMGDAASAFANHFSALQGGGVGSPPIPAGGLTLTNTYTSQASTPNGGVQGKNTLDNWRKKWAKYKEKL